MDAAPGPRQTDDVIDFRAVTGVLRRRLWLMLIVAGLIIAGTVAALALIEPRYEATAQVVIGRVQEPVPTDTAPQSDRGPESAKIDTEAEVLRSPALAARVAERLRKAGDPLIRDVPPAQAIDMLQSGLDVRRAGLTYAINITYQSDDPQTAARVANAFAEEYVSSQLDADFAATQRASTWLNERLDGLRDQVLAADAAVQQYRAQTGLLNSSGQGDTIAQEEISELTAQLASARASQAEAEGRLRAARGQLSRGGGGADVGAALNSDTVGRLREQRSEISSQVADLEARYGPRHPDLLRVRGQLEDIDQQIQAEVNRNVSNLAAQAQVARDRTSSLQASLNQSRGTLASNATAQVRLNELERNAESVRAVYQSYLDRFKQTSAQQGIEQSEARITARARAPEDPAFPNQRLMLAAGLILAFGAAGASALVAEALNNSLSTSRDVEKKLGLPALGSVPTLASTLKKKDAYFRSLPPADFVLQRRMSYFAESFRMIRAALFPPGTKTGRVLVVTSALPGEGKTTTAFCLARTAAIAGERVVLVDGDLRRGASSSLVVMRDTDPVLMDVLTGKATLDQALRDDLAPGLSILPHRPAPDMPDGVFATQEMEQLLAELRSRFDTVVIDTAPVLAVAETRLLAAKADALLLLVRWRKTPTPAVQAAVRMLADVGAEVSGVALTQVNIQEQARTAQGDVAGYYAKVAKYYS